MSHYRGWLTCKPVRTSISWVELSLVEKIFGPKPPFPQDPHRDFALPPQLARKNKAFLHRSRWLEMAVLARPSAASALKKAVRACLGGASLLKLAALASLWPAPVLQKQQFLYTKTAQEPLLALNTAALARSGTHLSLALVLSWNGWLIWLDCRMGNLSELSLRLLKWILRAL